MSRSIDAAHALMHCSDDFIGSVESIECILIESIYHNNEGNLRRAWICLRRALTIAQVLGLQLSHSPSTKALKPNTKTSQEHLWFHLIQMDRYLSLMLGLPQCVSKSHFATPDALTACTPTERLQRLDCAAAGLILERNEAEIEDKAAVQEIDRLLRDAAASVPSQRWMIPSLAPASGDNIESSNDINRLFDQFAHYHLVVRLHLPYFLRDSAIGKHEYSQTTVVNASRDILVRYVAFHSSNLAQSYCRGIDLLMFLACTMLCLAHMNAHRRNFVHTNKTGELSAFGFLAHQRPADRGMMEYALEKMHLMAQDFGDMMASRIASVVQHLLKIEGDSANGGKYNASASTNDGEQLETVGRLSDEGNVLHIHVPSFGPIKIERDGTLKTDLAMSSTLEDSHPPRSVQQPIHPPARMSQSSFPLSEDQNELFLSSVDFGAEDWTLQGVDTALFDSLIRGGDLDAEMS